MQFYTKHTGAVTTLSAVSLALLCACSSADSAPSHAPTDVVSTTPQPTPSTATTSTATTPNNPVAATPSIATPTTTSAITGYNVVLKDGAGEYSAIAQNALESVMVNGKLVKIIKDGLPHEKRNNLDYDGTPTLFGGDGKPTGRHHRDYDLYTFSKWGYAREGEAVDGAIFYAQGEHTRTMPTGLATYTGKAIYRHKSDSFAHQNGTVDMRADFANKNLTGAISLIDNSEYINDKMPAKTISIDSKIDGANFAQTGVITIKGGFYGDSAQEVAGVFSDDKGAGAFGARKNP